MMHTLIYTTKVIFGFLSKQDSSSLVTAISLNEVKENGLCVSKFFFSWAFLIGFLQHVSLGALRIFWRFVTSLESGEAINQTRHLFRAKNI